MTGGGSGGHIIPLLPLARALKARCPGARVVYIGLKGEKISAGQRLDVFDEIARVTSGKLRRYHGESLFSHLLDIKTIVLNVRDFFKVIFGFFTALKLLRKYRPAVVFSKGGYVTVPVGMAARWRHIPIVTHDSDTVPGLANRIVGRWAQLHASGLPPRYFNYPKETIRYTGVPVDERVKPVSEALARSLKQQIELPKDCLMLLVAGGGHGSRRLNELIVAIAPQLLKRHPKLRIVHFSGSGWQDAVAAQYRRELDADTADRVKVVGFSNDFYVYSGAADVVVARAGASTLTELAIQRKAAVIIPSPFLTGGHQLKNAEELTTLGAAQVLPNDVEPPKLLNVLDDLLQNKQRRDELAHKISSLARPDAADKLADILLEVSHQK